MTDEIDYEELMDLVAQARATRDRAIEEAHTQFNRVIAEAYEQGLSTYDINRATGMAMGTIRGRLREAGVVIRR